MTETVASIPSTTTLASDGAPTSSSPVNHAPNAASKTARPSCNLCRQSKIKCDRADPCSHCSKIGATCHYSAPSKVARGRKGGRRKQDSLLLNRLNRLETLIQEIEAGTFTAPATASAAPNGTQIPQAYRDPQVSKAARPRPSTNEPDKGLHPYLGSSVWLNLSESIHGLREVFDEPSEDEDEDSEQIPKSVAIGPDLSSLSAFAILPPYMFPSVDAALTQPTLKQIALLYSTFMTNVDPSIKLLHGPSLRKYLIEGAQSLDCSPGRRGWDAVRFSIFFAATNSLDPDECWKHFGEDRNVLLSRFRLGTEIALAKADFVVSEEMSILQALVLYLFAVRATENSRRLWTLTSLVVRNAHDLGLHREKHGDTFLWPRSQFECEMRRRLWWQICHLDRLGMSDRGSDPIIADGSFDTKLPLNINDEDLIPGSKVEVRSQDCYTDTTFSLVVHQAFHAERRLNDFSAKVGKKEAADLWAERRSSVIECQRCMEDKYLRYCDANITIQRYTMQVADIMMARLWLWAYRPLQWQSNGSFATQPPYPGILHFSVEVLDKAVKIPLDAAFKPYRWIANVWVQWHALAVMIAELCVQTEGPTVERAWTLAPVIFEDTARHVADSANGRLWRPIKKLMSKAQTVRKQHLEDVGLASGFVPMALGSQYVQPINQQQSSGGSAGSAMEWSMEAPQIQQAWAHQIPIQQQQGTPLSFGNSESMGLSWDGWLNGTAVGTHANNEMNQMSWNDWESFVNDFQADMPEMPEMP